MSVQFKKKITYAWCKLEECGFLVYKAWNMKHSNHWTNEMMPHKLFVYCIFEKMRVKEVLMDTECKCCEKILTVKKFFIYLHFRI